MKLLSSPASPFGAKVKIWAHMLGLQTQLQVEAIDTIELAQSGEHPNPLGKIRPYHPSRWLHFRLCRDLRIFGSTDRVGVFERRLGTTGLFSRREWLNRGGPELGI